MRLNYRQIQFMHYIFILTTIYHNTIDGNVSKILYGVLSDLIQIVGKLLINASKLSFYIQIHLTY